MKEMSKRTFRKRGLAFIMALLMIVSIFPSAGVTVSAQTDKHQGFVTVTVTDADGAAINGATVTYTIKEKENGTNNFQTINQSGETDSYGTIEVLESSKYYDDLTITASVSKEGYATDTTTINEADITSDTQDFSVKLTAESKPESLPDIDGVSIEVLNADYNGEPQNLVSVSAATEDVTIEYSRDGNTWVATCPSETNAGEYPVYVKITKDGYSTYLSGEQTAKINKGDITGIDITAKEVEYKDATEQELVLMTGAFDEKDTVTWYVNGKSTGSQDIPKQLAVGEYTVKLVVQRDNYNDFEKTVTAKISNAKINLGDLKVTGLDGIYNGKAQDAVKVENQGDYTLYYQLDDGSQIADPDAWDTTIPTITNAGSYIVWVKATKQYYDDKNVDVIKAENAVAPYNVYLAKASQVISFDKYTGEETSVEITQAEMEAGKEFIFTATDKEKKAGGTITYSVAFDEGDDEIAAIDSQTGVLVVKGAGKITIKAVLSGNDNYNECIIEHVLYVKGKSAAGEWISFPENTIEYILGNAKGITENIAVKKEDKDKGAISYSIKNGSDLGLRIDSKSGVISIADYSKVMESLEAGNGILNVTVKADKAEYSKRGWWSKANYPADSTSYTLKISMSEAPTSAYKIYAADDLETELINPNGENDWYNTTLVVKPADGYSIIRADELTKDKPSFKDSVKFGETEAKDQGASLSHYIYLEEIATGNITKKVEISNLKLDTIAPYNLNIDFPDVEEKDSVKYYGDYITVTFTAYDVTSGVDHFDWKYTRENGASNSNLESDNGTVSAQVDKDDPNKYSATLTLPRNKAEQLRGNLQVTAIDKAGNNSVSYTDDGVFVIDTIAPTQKVEYKLKNNDGSNQIVGEKHYFSNDVEVTFKIVEANFYSEDVTITVSKNNGSAEKQSVTWTDTENSDEYQATYTYNGLGHRVGQKISSLIPEYPEKKIRYTIDMTRQYYNLLQKSEGGASQTYYWDGNVVGMESNGVEKFYLQDDFGSPMHLVDIYGTSQECFAFDEFGENLSTSYNNTSQTFGFTGYQTDEVGDLYYAQARRYDASVGRFVSEDKVRGFVILPYTLNHYGYCWNNPVDFVDRDGNLPTVVIGAVIGLAAGALGEVVSQTIDGVQSGKSVLDSLLDVNPGKVVLEAGKGAVTGAVAGTGAGLLVVAGTSGVVEFGGDLLDQKVLQKKEDLDYTHAISNGLWSATTTLVVGGITNEISNVIHPEAKTGTMDYLFGRDKAKAVVKAQYNNARSSSSRAKYWNRLEKIKLQKTLGTIKYGIIETGKTIIDEIKNEIYRDEVNEDIVEEIDKKISCSVY